MFFESTPLIGRFLRIGFFAGLFCASITASLWNGRAAEAGSETKTSAGGSIEAWLNVPFATMGGEELFLNLYRPAETTGTLPLIVHVHGGGWKGENTAEQLLEMQTTETLHMQLDLHPSGWNAGPNKGIWPVLPFWLVNRGYAMASIAYRSSDKALFPAQIEDCKAAIRWLRANAKVFGFDPDRIGICGGSAGGHLVSLLGTIGDASPLNAHEPAPKESCKVRAVCSIAGPSDFLDLIRRHPGETYAFALKLMAELIGGDLQANAEKVRMANPIQYISSDDPPFLLIHGDQDKLVPLSQSEIFHQALQKAGVESTLHVVKGADHIFVSPDADKAMAEFFDEHLKRGSCPSESLPESPR